MYCLFPKAGYKREIRLLQIEPLEDINSETYTLAVLNKKQIMGTAEHRDTDKKHNWSSRYRDNITVPINERNVFVQNADKLKNEGDAALNTKDYTMALAKYKEYLKLNGYKDIARIYNTGYSAYQIKNYAEAVKFFNMSIKNNFNVDDAYIGVLISYRNLNNTKDFIKTATERLKTISPDNKDHRANIEKLIYAYCIKQGQAAQKKGDLVGAKKLYSEVLAVSNKTYQGNALYSLGAMFYSNGAKILQAAIPTETTDPDKYNTEKAKAFENLKKAKDYLTKELEVNPNDVNSKKILEATNNVLYQYQ